MTDQTSVPDEGALAPSEETDAKRYSRKTDPDKPRRRDIVPNDWLLHDLIDSIFGLDDSAEEAYFGLTLAIGGVVVSGLAIPHKTWANGITTSIDGDAEYIGAGLKEIWAADAVRNDEFRDRRDAADLPRYARRYIHFKEARVIAGGIDVNVPFWRGRLRDVSGWSLGSHNTPETADDTE